MSNLSKPNSLWLTTLMEQSPTLLMGKHGIRSKFKVMTTDL